MTSKGPYREALLIRGILLACILFFYVTEGCLATPQVLIDTDFGTTSETINDVDAQSGKHIVGAAPAGWFDNTGWKQEVEIEYKVVTEGDRRFLRIKQTRGDGIQFAHALPGLEKEEGRYRLTMTARSPGGTGAMVVMRFVGAPYSTCWSAGADTISDWKEFTYDFHLDRQPQPIGLWVNTSSNGVLDLSHLRLVKLTREDIIEEIKARYPDSGPKNLVRISRFPLGLQSGWSLDRDFSDGDEVNIASDRSVIGPSGAPALWIDSEKMMRLYTAPFEAPWSFQPHTVSLSLRGDATGKLVVVGDGKQLAEKAFQLKGPEWQRLSLTFTPVLEGKAHGLRIDANGHLWIDAMQVENGTQAHDYTPQMPAEVALSLPPSDAAAARVQFDDERAAIVYCVTGNASGALLRTKVINLYRQEERLPAVILKKDFLQEGLLRYDAFPDKPYGVLRIEAWVENNVGERISACNEIVVNRLHRPRYWGKDAPNSPFGTHTLSTTRHLVMAKAIGCNWVRLHDAGTAYIGWSFLEPEQGKWTFFDRDLFRYRKHGLKILGMLSTAPGWATDWGRPATDYFDRYFEPQRMEEWADYVRTVVARYQGVIDSYEVWNEPYIHDFWIAKYDRVNTQKAFMQRLIRSETPEKDYALLLKTAYLAAKATDPKVRILGFCTAPAEWTAQILAAGGLENCDVVSYHNYVGGRQLFPSDTVTRQYNTATSPIVKERHELPKPIWMSEGNCLGSNLENGFYHYTVASAPIDATENVVAADRLCRYVISNLTTGAGREFVYSMHCHQYFGEMSEWSALVTAEGYLHPSAAAHSAMAWLLEDTRFVKRIEPASGVFAYLFAGRGRAVAVLSGQPGHADYTVPFRRETVATDLFGNPLPKGERLQDTLIYLAAAKGVETLERLLLPSTNRQR